MFYITLCSFIITLLSLLYFFSLVIKKYILHDKIESFILKFIISLSFTILFWLSTYSLNAVYERIQDPHIKDGVEEYSGTFGDLIGGTLSPILALFGILAGGLAFYVQYQANELQKGSIREIEKREYKTNFETNFFELLRIHRENVKDQNYDKTINGHLNNLEGRIVFRQIHKEFEECYQEVKRFSKMFGQYDFILESYKNKLKKIIKNNNLRISPTELAFIDIAYSIVFYGVGRESETYLFHKFSYKYKNDFYSKLIKFVQLKPNRENIANYNAWTAFKNQKINIIKPLFLIAYENRRNSNFVFLIEDTNIMHNYDLIKYYGGHQHRLGHYFRHLFQTFKFIENQDILDNKQKYFYGKTLRSQLSTYEQSLLFLNSVSSLGFKWEYNPEKSKKGVHSKLITKYALIKNVSGRKLLDISYKNFFPKIKFEYEDII
jgi:hypothetical protein